MSHDRPTETLPAEAGLAAPSDPPLRIAAADRPWFWLMLYAGAGLVLLAVVAPRHQRRQARIDRMADARSQAFAEQSRGIGPVLETGPQLDAGSNNGWGSLRWLALILAALMIGGAIWMARSQRAGNKPLADGPRSTGFSAASESQECG